MHDTFAIQHNGKTYLGRRFLRLDHGKTYQTVFYLDRARCDPAGYSNFDRDDPAMSESGARMLADIVDETPRGGRPAGAHA